MTAATRAAAFPKSIFSGVSSIVWQAVIMPLASATQSSTALPVERPAAAALAGKTLRIMSAGMGRIQSGWARL